MPVKEEVIIGFRKFLVVLYVCVYIYTIESQYDYR